MRLGTVRETMRQWRLGSGVAAAVGADEKIHENRAAEQTLRRVAGDQIARLHGT